MKKDNIDNIVLTPEHIKVSEVDSTITPINKELDTLIPQVILKTFRHLTNEKCWCFCNEQKIPVQYNDPSRKLLWKEDPEKGVVTLIDLLKSNKPHVGFGIILSPETSVACLDFDHFLKNGQPVYNNKVNVFAEMCPTYVEVSSSGNGLHAFYTYSKDIEGVHEFGIDIKKFGINLSDEEIEKLRLAKELPDGKFYPNRFIKLTGKVYNDNNYMMWNFDKYGYKSLTDAIAIQSIIPKAHINYQSSLTGNYREWSDILCEAGLLHMRADSYINKVSPKSRKLVIDAWKILCPNVNNHQTRREGDPSADIAILCKYEDGTSSCTCNHSSCKPEGRPNLMQKLWNEIKKPSIELGDKTLKELGVI